jgi:hypothetical protein
LRKFSIQLGLALAALIWAAPDARATFVINVTQDGPNLDFSGSGSLNLTGATYHGTSNPMSYYFPIFGELVLGSDPGDNVVSDSYAITGPSTFGTTYAGGDFSSGTGGRVGFNMSAGDVYVPLGYISGTDLSSTDVLDGQTFATLGVSPGTYTWSLPNDQIILNIGVPEPRAITLFAVPAVVSLYLTRRRRARGAAPTSPV